MKNIALPVCRYILSGLVVIISVTLISCSDPEETRQKHLQQASKHMDAGRYDKARIELKNVLQIDPGSANSYYMLGNIEERNQNWRKAIGFYYKTTELSPTHHDAHIRLGHIFLLMAVNSKARDDIDAEKSFLVKTQEHIDSVLNDDMTNINAGLLKASLLYHNGATQEAISRLELILQSSPTYKDAILLLARLYRQTGMDEKARNVIISGIASSPDEIELKVELAKFYDQNKQYDKAIEVMQDIISRSPDDLGYRLSLAAYYSKKEEYGHAEDVFLDAIRANKNDINRHLAYIAFIKQRKGTQAAIDYINRTINTLDNSEEIQIRLATLYYEAGAHEQANTLLKEIIKRYQTGPIAMHARKKLATFYISSGKTDDALLLSEEILHENANDYEALIIKGRILFATQKYNEAIMPFRMALKTQPDSIEAIHLLADSHLKNGDIALASDTFKRAVEIAPDDIKSRLKLARFLIAAGNIEPAYQQITAVLENNADNLEALTLETEILMAQKKIQDLIKLLDKIKKLSPDSAEAWFRMGRVYKSLNKNELAREEFLLAHEKDPDSIDLLAELTDIELGLGNTAASVTRLSKILESQADHPVAHKFLGMVYLSENKPEHAEKEFRLHLEHAPEDVSAYIQLANIHFKLGNLNQAARYYLSAKELAADNTDILAGLAQIRTLQKEYDEAIELYEKSLTLQPQNAVITNNLAILLADIKADPDSLARARKLIEKSSARSHPALQDTLGWIHYREGNYPEAIRNLELAVNKAPAYPTFHYHLGKAHMGNGNNKLAEKHLRNSLQLGNFPEKNDAVKSLELLQSRLTPAE